jgi:hypothetical protein
MQNSRRVFIFLVVMVVFAAFAAATLRNKFSAPEASTRTGLR